MPDLDVFRQYLVTRKLDDRQIENHLQVADRFEAFLEGQVPQKAQGEAFVEQWRTLEEDNYDNLMALMRYAWFNGYQEVYVHTLALLDGGEVMGNLHQRLGETFGDKLRDEIFEGIELPGWGTSNACKSPLMGMVIERMERLIGGERSREFLSRCMRDLPDRLYEADRELYSQSASFDDFLARKRARFMANLQDHKERGELFFGQPITQEVIDFVRADPEIATGVREGDRVMITKIPYMTQSYLEETDPVRRRYYYCHCPWARESVIRDDHSVSATFCSCSAGFVKKGLEAVFERVLEVEVLESVLRGDDRCRFAIHLPEDAL